MRVDLLLVAKYPPIERGVSQAVFHTARALVDLGHSVNLITNAGEVELGYREMLPADDESRIVGSLEGQLHVRSTLLRPTGVPAAIRSSSNCWAKRSYWRPLQARLGRVTLYERYGRDPAPSSPPPCCVAGRLARCP